MVIEQIRWWRTSFGKEEANQICNSIEHEYISQGPVTAEFEEKIAKFLGVPYVVVTTSGSIAILLALMAAGIRPDDEVIVPNRTWIATAHAPLILGAKVRLGDVELTRPLMDVTQIENLITPRTKAIIPVHLNGRSVDMREVHRIAQKNDLIIIEDAAQALGSRNEDGFLGTQSDMGCFSLSVSKIISTGQGGFVVTKNENLYKKLVAIRTHGVSDIINAQWTQLGFNFRFTDILASIGIHQINRLPERIEKVNKIYKRYETGIKDLPFIKLIPVDIKKGEIPIYIETLCPDREKLIKFLAAHSIETRPFYPDLNLAPYFENAERFPNSEVFGNQGLFLPSGPVQSMENIDRVINTLKKFKDNT
ncbi:MAG: DegT/DnrJ/EryC1/StrS family aminotransferase [Methanoregula sp.]|nr:DegT/DnrJ/EryC1/StrS family aminotransferase [Methanoregula sp.]